MTDMKSIISPEHILEPIFKLWEKISKQLIDIIPELISLIIISVVLGILNNVAFLYLLEVSPNKIGLSIYDVIMFDEIIMWFFVLFAVCCVAYVIDRMPDSLFVALLTLVIFPLALLSGIQTREDLFNIDRSAALGFAFLIATCLHTSFLVYLVYSIRKFADEERNLRKANKKNTIISLGTHLCILIFCVAVVKFTNFHLEALSQCLSKFNNPKTIITPLQSTHIGVIFIGLYLLTKFKKARKLKFIALVMLFAVVIDATFKESAVSRSFFCEKMESSVITLKDNSKVEADIIKTFFSGSLLINKEGIQFIKSDEIASILFRVENKNPDQK